MSKTCDMCVWNIYDAMLDEDYCSLRAEYIPVDKAEHAEECADFKEVEG